MSSTTARKGCGPTLPLREMTADQSNKLVAGASRRAVDRWFRTLARASQAVLLLDYDGTLAPFTVERDQAAPYPGVSAALQEIIDRTQTRVVIISGRQAPEVVSLLGVDPPPEIFGLYGLQRLRADGGIDELPFDPLLAEALVEAERWLDYQGLRDLAEFKPGSIALHWRGLSQNRVTEVRERALLGWRPIAEGRGLALEPFDGGLEIRRKDCNKGDAVRAVLADVEEEIPAAYLGDDSADEQAFLAMRGRGLTVLVRPKRRETRAEAWLRPPQELLEFLSRWLEIGQPRAARKGAKALTAGAES